jgi:hypothetical protein
MADIAFGGRMAFNFFGGGIQAIKFCGLVDVNSLSATAL